LADHEFITEQQVRSACEKLGISDWSAKKDGSVDKREAELIRLVIGGETLDIPLAEFKSGLEIELEHGVRFPEANVSGNHPIATGRIVLAHLKESLDYYLRLECMELEMELTKALAQGDPERAVAKRRALATARETLEKRIYEALSKKN